MRSAQKILHKHLNVKFDEKKYPHGYPYIIEAINDARIECIRECANRATVMWNKREFDKQKLLSLIDEVK